MAIATNLGFPRIGEKRELKSVLEQFWKGHIDEAALRDQAEELQRRHWLWQHEADITHLPVGDFSLYDHVLDWVVRVGAVPARYAGLEGLTQYFAMARGTQGEDSISAMEMTKWFDTNYHYIVPEWTEKQSFAPNFAEFLEQVKRAREIGSEPRPVILGPVSLLRLGKAREGDFDPITLLDLLIPVYESLLGELQTLGIEWIQLDEPCLVLDLDEPTQAAIRTATERLAASAPGLKVVLGTYFGDLRANLPLAMSLPVAAVHLDLVRAPGQLAEALPLVGAEQSLSLGLVDGRNVWRTDLAAALGLAEQAGETLGPDRLLIGPSCSLLHSPVDLTGETRIDPEIQPWLAFARQKLEEIELLTQAINHGRPSVADRLQENAEIIQRRKTSTRTTNREVRERLSHVTAEMTCRQSPYAQRSAEQRAKLSLPLFPTTTIGSFPQTAEVRRQRALFRQGKLGEADYPTFLEQHTEACIRLQEDIGLDVLVHGEFERNDMVEFFGERLEGFLVCENGWVQSYGSRCVKPPIIYGDVTRPEPMTVPFTRLAQSLTEKPVKGMLTGPVTILCWSFVRDDQPRSETCRQIALAIRDEVLELEAAGIGLIQIDEPAIREGLPLRKVDHAAYLTWAVESFRLSACGVADETQIHTHMCYSEFHDILSAIADLDADVISIETSRSQMELLDAFVDFNYPNEIGPGVYDIHSPRVPTTEEMVMLLEKAAQVVPAERLWVNPDCGLKTRDWPEVEASLRRMVEAAGNLRHVGVTV